MCRIFGSYNWVPDTATLDRVAHDLRHGGPDEQSFASGSIWSLGSARLSVMDPLGGQQPYRLGSVTVVFNGEIYNHDELRAYLRGRGHEFQDHCDGSILPALYLTFGDRFTDHIDGMYAVAVIDERAEPRLVLASDDAGMKSLYYTFDEVENRLFFASELGALFAFGRHRPVENAFGLDEYLAAKAPFGDRTMFAGVHVLPPATTAVVTRRAGLQLTSRWAAVGESGSRADRTLQDVGAELEALLRREVSRLLCADVPVAAITSGGLDSSLVTALGASANPALNTFNIAYRGRWPSDERTFAGEVAAHVGTTHHQVELDPEDFPVLLPDLIRHLGQPNADPITLSSFALFGAVRDAGFKVAITGDAADEMFGGYARMSHVALAERPESWIETYLDDLAAIPKRLRGRLYSDDFRDALPKSGLPPAFHEILEDTGRSGLARVLEAERRYRLPSYHLRRVDHLSMASSVEARIPFCQRSIVHFAATLGDDQRITTDGVKRALYAAADGLLPRSILTRPKQPFTLPIEAMLAPGQALWTCARDTLSTSTLLADGRLRADAVQQLFRVQAERPSKQASLAIWSLMVHQLWRQEFFTEASALSRRAPALALEVA